MGTRIISRPSHKTQNQSFFWSRYFVSRAEHFLGLEHLLLGKRQLLSHLGCRCLLHLRLRCRWVGRLWCVNNLQNG